jgi:CPA1 family monovalent cation:H+ antiporter
VQSQVYALLLWLAVMAAASALAERRRWNAPALLIGLGIALGAVPGVPQLEIEPGLLLALVLPPLVWSDAMHTSWRDFRRWLRPILMLSVGLVAVTIASVGCVAHALCPQLPWPACFLLGALVSPTDTVAVQAILERLHAPRRVTAILGGESLVNDATGLVGVQVATALLLSGAFEASALWSHFARVAGLGVAVGLLIGAALALVNRRTTNVHALFSLSLAAPYLAYVLAEELHASGILAVVVAGFLAAWNAHQLHGEARVELDSAWRQLVFVGNSTCFLFIGVQTPQVLRSVELLEQPQLMAAGLAVTATALGVRVLWCSPPAVLSYFGLGRRLFQRDGLSSWRNTAIVSWAGMRGFLSLAVALALPTVGLDGQPLAWRNPVIACALVVVLGSLALQGLTLQRLVHALGVRDEDDTAGEVRRAKESLLQAGIARLDSYCSETACPLSVHHFRVHMADELQTLRDEDADERRSALSRMNVSRQVRLEVAAAQERALLHLRDSGRINDKTYDRLRLELDQSMLSLAREAA